MKYFLRFPPHYTTCGPHELTEIFDAYRAWLEKNIGAEKEQWEYMRGDLHAMGVFLPTRNDMLAFKLRFQI